MKQYTATAYNYGFEHRPDFIFTDSTFKNVWNAVIRTIKDFAHNDAAYDNWRVKFEANGEVLDIYIMVRSNPYTGWTDVFASNKGITHYITSTLAQ